MFRPATYIQKADFLLVGGGDFFRPDVEKSSARTQKENEKTKERGPEAIGVNESAAQLA